MKSGLVTLQNVSISEPKLLLVISTFVVAFAMLLSSGRVFLQMCGFCHCFVFSSSYLFLFFTLCIIVFTYFTFCKALCLIVAEFGVCFTLFQTIRSILSFLLAHRFLLFLNK